MDAMRLNQQTTIKLEMILESLEAALEKNREMQRDVENLLDPHGRRRPRHALNAAFSKPFFLESTGELPPPNEDTEKKREANELIPAGYAHRRWMYAELDALNKGVVQLCQQHLLRAIFDNESSRNIEWMVREKEKMESLSVADLANAAKVEQFSDKDWNDVARRSVPRRSGLECRIRWLEHEDPRLNKGEWGADEDLLLRQLASRHNGHNWHAVADEMSQRMPYRRTAAQCLARHSRIYSAPIKKTRWTQEEDDQLRHAVALVGEGKWIEISRYVPGREGNQCMHRWIKCLRPGLRHGKWNDEEDDALRRAVAKYGSRNWVLIAQHVPGRTDVKCRERWMNVLDPSLCRNEWTEEENARLVDSVRKYGAKWAFVARDLLPRTDSQCSRQARKLAKTGPTEIAVELQAILGIQGEGEGGGGGGGGGAAAAGRRKAKRGGEESDDDEEDDEEEESGGDKNSNQNDGADSRQSSQQQSKSRKVTKKRQIEDEAWIPPQRTPAAFRPIEGINSLAATMPPTPAAVGALEKLLLLLRSDAEQPIPVEGGGEVTSDPSDQATAQLLFNSAFSWPTLAACVSRSRADATSAQTRTNSNSESQNGDSNNNDNNNNDSNNNHDVHIPTSLIPLDPVQQVTSGARQWPATAALQAVNFGCSHRRVVYSADGPVDS